MNFIDHALPETVGGGTVEEFNQQLVVLRDRLTKVANDLGVKLAAGFMGPLG